MSVTFYVEETHDGGWAVQRVEDGREDFYSYHRTEAEARASLVNAYKREAAEELYAACEAAGEIIERDNAEGADRWALWALLDAAIKKAKGESGD